MTWGLPREAALRKPRPGWRSAISRALVIDVATPTLDTGSSFDRIGPPTFIHHQRGNVDE